MLWCNKLFPFSCADLWILKTKKWTPCTLFPGMEGSVWETKLSTWMANHCVASPWMKPKVYWEPAVPRWTSFLPEIQIRPKLCQLLRQHQQLGPLYQQRQLTARVALVEDPWVPLNVDAGENCHPSRDPDPLPFITCWNPNRGFGLWSRLAVTVKASSIIITMFII